MLDQTRDRRRLERHDALVERPAALRVERDRQAALFAAAGECGERRIGRKLRGRFFPLRRRAKIERVAAFDDGEAHRTCACQLHDQAAVELQCRSDQRCCCTKLGQRARKRRWIGMTGENIARCPVEPDECAAYRRSVEYEARQPVGQRHQASGSV